MPAAAVIAILARDHPRRDGWVDAHARSFFVDMRLPIDDSTYQGVWRWPTPEHPLVHVFALPEDMSALVEHGLTRDGDA